MTTNDAVFLFWLPGVLCTPPPPLALERVGNTSGLPAPADGVSISVVLWLSCTVLDVAFGSRGWMISPVLGFEVLRNVGVLWNRVSRTFFRPRVSSGLYDRSLSAFPWADWAYRTMVLGERRGQSVGALRFKRQERTPKSQQW